MIGDSIPKLNVHVAQKNLQNGCDVYVVMILVRGEMTDLHKWSMASARQSQYLMASLHLQHTP